MGPKKQNDTSTFSQWFGHNMGSSDLQIYIGLHLYGCFKSSISLVMVHAKDIAQTADII